MTIRYILPMQKGLLKLFSILFIVGSIYGGAYLDYFHGRSENEDVRLEWKTSEEVNLKEFIIERKSYNSSYAELTTIQPKGSNSIYTYLDESAYKTNDIVFIYRLKIVDSDGSTSYSNEVSVSHSVSGVKRTWGSIKAMFR